MLQTFRVRYYHDSQTKNAPFNSILLPIPQVVFIKSVSSYHMVQYLAMMDTAINEIGMKTYWLASNRTVITARSTLKTEVS